MGSEKNFENKIKTYLKDKGCWFVKYFANRMTKSGIPDILVCVNGYFLAIEVKASNGKPSDLQIHHRDAIRKSGGLSIIIYPNQFDDFKLLVDDLIERPQQLDWNEQKEFDK